MEKQLPYKIKTFTSLNELRVGDLLLAEADSPGACDNCDDPDGLLYFRRLLSGGGRVTWVTDAHGQRRLYYAELLTAPCPVCRPHKTAPDLDKRGGELPDAGNEINSPRDWTV